MWPSSLFGLQLAYLRSRNRSQAILLWKCFWYIRFWNGSSYLMNKNWVIWEAMDRIGAWYYSYYSIVLESVNQLPWLLNPQRRGDKSFYNFFKIRFYHFFSLFLIIYSCVSPFLRLHKIKETPVSPIIVYYFLILLQLIRCLFRYEYVTSTKLR